MNKLLLLAITVLLSFTTFAQVKFEPGYFIDNEGNRVECFIRNSDRSTVPTTFVYSLSEDGAQSKIVTMAEAQEFAIHNSEHKYRRQQVLMDRSSDKNQELSFVREPVFKQEVLFLRVLLEGKVSLYEFNEKSGLQRFFIQADTGGVKQLVYKKYTTDGTAIQENKSYKQQLWIHLQCESLKMEEFDRIDYQKRELIKVISKYNECAGAAYTTFEQGKKRGKLQLTAKVGANYATFKLQKNGLSENIQESKSKVSPQVGFEVEYVLPFNSNRNAVFIAPTYIHYQHQQDFNIYGRNATMKINHAHIMLPVGVRRYFFLDNDSKVFINGAFSYNKLLDEENGVEVTNASINTGIDHKTGLKTSLVFGGGYSFKNRFSVEGSYHTDKVMSDNHYWKTSLANTVAITVNYTIK